MGQRPRCQGWKGHTGGTEHEGAPTNAELLAARSQLCPNGATLPPARCQLKVNSSCT